MKLPPYTGLLKATLELAEDGTPVMVMPFHDDVLGRPGFLQGGAISGLLEVAAIAALRHALESEGGGRIKPINVTVDFMRGGRGLETRAAGRPQPPDRGGADEVPDRAGLSGQSR